MAFKAGRTAAIWSGSKDLTSYFNSVDFATDTDTAETSTFGNTFKSYLAGLSGGTLSVSGSYDPGTSAPPYILFTNQRTSVAIVYRPGGTGSGQLQYAFNGIITRIGVGSSVGDRVTFTADILADGTITQTVQ